MKNLKEKNGIEIINLNAQKELKGGNNSFEDGCPPDYNPKFAVLNAMQTR